MTKEIQLTRGKVAVVDDSDFEWLKQWKWQAHKRHDTWYACRNTNGNIRVEIKMHRAILRVADPGVHVDHKDGDGLNNQRYNLRKCTPTQNKMNAGVQKNNKLGLKGVSQNPVHKKFAARIGVDGKVLHLGLFTDPIQAAKAYDAAAKKYHGEFARLNFPES